MSQSMAKTYKENAMRITMSGWMRRLWTLQGGVLAQNLYFKFSDVLVEMEELEADFPVENSSLESSVPEAARVYYRGPLRLEKAVTENRKELLASIWRAAQGRRTSHRSDETIAFATLLKIDPERLLQLQYKAKKDSPDEARQMQQLFMSLVDLGGIPPGMIFLPGLKLP